MFCRKCGTQIPDHARFCPKCGTQTPVLSENQMAVNEEEDLSGKIEEQVLQEKEPTVEESTYEEKSVLSDSRQDDSKTHAKTVHIPIRIFFIIFIVAACVVAVFFVLKPFGNTKKGYSNTRDVISSDEESSEKENVRAAKDTNADEYSVMEEAAETDTLPEEELQEILDAYQAEVDEYPVNCDIALVYINDDDIPEAVLRTRNQDYVMYYQDGQVYFVESLAGAPSIFRYKEKSGIFAIYSYYADAETEEYEIDGRRYEFYRMSVDGQTYEKTETATEIARSTMNTYNINEKSVSKTELDQLLDNYQDMWTDYYIATNADIAYQYLIDPDGAPTSSKSTYEIERLEEKQGNYNSNEDEVLDYNGEYFAGDYIIFDSSERRLTSSDLEYLTPQELTYARNEIFARHGHLFSSSELQEYFESKSWYSPASSNEIADSSMSKLETDNAGFIRDYQKNNNKEYTPH